MRIRQALALVFLVALCGAATVNAAPTKSSAATKATVVCPVGDINTTEKPCTPTPRCASGQKTTKAKPCLTAAEFAVVNAKIKAAARGAEAREQAPINIDPANVGERQGRGDAVTVVTFLNHDTGLYRLDVTNTSALGFINTFNWHPPRGMTITSIVTTEGGKCTLVEGNINCRGAAKGIAPPKCTCLPGASLKVKFYADGLKRTFNGQWYTYYGIDGAALQILTMTPVNYHIPSFLPQYTDLPVCKKGQTPGKTCVAP